MVTSVALKFDFRIPLFGLNWLRGRAFASGKFPAPRVPGMTRRKPGEEFLLPPTASTYGTSVHGEHGNEEMDGDTSID